MVPPGDVRVLNRELLYTGVTRARRQLSVAATTESVQRTIGRRSRRASGLVEAILGREPRALQQEPAPDAAAPGPPQREPQREPGQLRLF